MFAAPSPTAPSSSRRYVSYESVEKVVYAPSSPIVSAGRSQEAVVSVRNHVPLQICRIGFSESSLTVLSIEFDFTEAHGPRSSVRLHFSDTSSTSLISTA
jgi:hypothetical protein